MTKRERSDYQREYYLNNRGKLSKSRHERYISDPEYRLNVLEKSRQYRMRRKAEKDAERAALVAEGLMPPPNGRRGPVRVRIGGTEVEAYTLPVLAERIGCSIHTVRNWIHVGVIPKTPFRSSRGDRLYTDDMILAVKMEIQLKSRISHESDVGEKIRSRWKRFGVVADQG